MDIFISKNGTNEKKIKIEILMIYYDYLLLCPI